MPMPSWKNDPFRKDLTDKDTVIGIARRMGDGYIVVKYKDRSIYNILHISNPEIHNPSLVYFNIP